MKISISAIGKIKTDRPESKLIESYKKRIPWDLSINEFEEKKSLEPEQLKQKESEILLASIKPDFTIIALDEKGKSMGSNDFAKYLEQCQNMSKNKLAFLIGGTYGHDQSVRQKSDLILSLSPLTFTHIMARILLVEQIYRAYSIINNHPYHKS